MDAKQYLKKHLKDNKVLKFIAGLLCGLTIVFTIVALISFNVKPKAALYDPVTTSKGEYAYLDIVAIDEWAAKYGDDNESYYAALGSDGLFYNVFLKDSKYNSMKDQQKYWTDESAVADPVRVSGVVTEVDSDVKDIFIELYGLENSFDYEQFFGYTYLDTTTTPNENTGYMWLTFALFGGLFSLVFLLIISPKASATKQSIKRLEKNGKLEEAKEALELSLSDKSPLILDKNFVISRKNGVIISYKDIAWIFNRTVSTYGVQTGAFVVINTYDGYSVQIPTDKVSTETINQLIDNTLAVNPNLLIGFAKENQKAFKDIIKQAKQQKL